MPPERLDGLQAFPVTKTWKAKGTPAEPDLAGARDRALLLVGFVGGPAPLGDRRAGRRTPGRAPEGLVASIPRSKANPEGVAPELVVLPSWGDRPALPGERLTGVDEPCEDRLRAGARPVAKGNRALARHLNPESINRLVQEAVARAGRDPLPYSAHSLRAGFVTYAHLPGASDRAIAHQSRHRSLATIGAFVRVHEAREDNAAAQLGLCPVLD